MTTLRRHVNKRIEEHVEAFLDVAREVIRGTRVINSVNYDLSALDTKTAVEWLQITIESTQIVKKNWISLRQSVDQMLFCLDWYINRCNTDLKRYREKLHDEQQRASDYIDWWSEED